ncbi:MAG: 30S ribosomal protein S8 [Proteobacteria bacterium]|nr:30S ribosomal protein S8 [Pseudomonadota bacterium]
MGMTDPIADLLSRIRNAQHAKHQIVSIPASNIKKAVLEILKHEGFIQDYAFERDDLQGVLNIILKYDKNDEGIILGLQRVSTPGCRRYVKAKEIPKVLGGLGVAILSTSRGVVSDRAARDLNVGGEVLAYVW